MRAREARLAGAQSRLIGARIHLSKLQRREAVARRTLARNLVSPAELSVGVITSFCGAPVFVYLLRTRYRVSL